MIDDTLVATNRSEYAYGLSVVDGSVQWRTEVAQAKLFGGATVGGMVLTSNDMWVQAAQGYSFLHPHDYLVAYDLQTRRVRWKKVLGRRFADLSRYIQDDVACDGARLLLDRPNQGAVWCLDLCSGWRLWRRTLDEETFQVSHPVISGNTVLALTGQGHLFGLDIKTGKTLWQVDLGERVEKPTDQVLVSGDYVIVAAPPHLWVFRSVSPGSHVGGRGSRFPASEKEGLP